MEIIRATDAKGVEHCYLRCETHNYWFKTLPPMTHGCNSCWMVYYTGQIAQSKGDKGDTLDALEHVLRKTAEEIEDGTWDFEPAIHPDIKYEREN